MSCKFSPLFWAVFILLAGAPCPAQTETPNPGPRSENEARFLFEEGSDAINRKDYKQGIRDFERLLERYPSDSNLKDAYLGLIEALLIEKRDAEAIKFGKESLELKWDEASSNRVRALMAEAELNLKNYLNARLMAGELLKAHPTAKQQALAHSVSFQSLLEEKQYKTAETELDLLSDQLKKEPIPFYSKLLPEFKMSFAMRQCTLTHLLKDKPITEEETIDYFKEKNLCFKEALPQANQVSNVAVLKEWCESFTVLNHELQKMRADPFLKEKIAQDLKSTFDLSKGIHVELSKCYAPFKPKKSRRKRRLRKA